MPQAQTGGRIPYETAQTTQSVGRTAVGPPARLLPVGGPHRLPRFRSGHQA